MLSEYRRTNMETEKEKVESTVEEKDVAETINAQILSKEKPEASVTDILEKETTPEGATGFINSIPKEFREEAGKFNSLKDYLADLTNRATNPTKEEDKTTWEELNDTKDDYGALALLKDASLFEGMTAGRAKGIVETLNKLNEASGKKLKEGLDSNMKAVWKDDYEKNKEYMEKGLKSYKNLAFWAKQNPNIVYNPMVADMLAELGKAQSTVQIVDTTNKGPASEQKKTNPDNVYGLNLEGLV